MKKKTIFKRVVSSVLAATIMFNTMPLNVFAANSWTGSNKLETKKGDVIKFSDIIAQVGEPDKTLAKDTYELTWEKGSKTVEVEIEDLLYHLRVGGNLYTNKSDLDAEISFPASGDYTICAGDADYELSIKEDSQWKSVWDTLHVLAKDAEAAVPVAEQEAEVKKAAVQAEQAKVDWAQAEVDGYQKELDDINQKLADADTSYQEELAKLAQSEEALNNASGLYTSAENVYNEAKAKYDSAPSYLKGVLKAALDAAEKVLASAKSGLETAQANFNNQKNTLSSIDTFKADLMLKKTAAETSLANAKAKLEEVKGPYNKAVSEYNTALDVVQQKKDAVDEAWNDIANHADAITSSDFNSTYVSYDASVETAVKTLTVDVYNELTVNTSVAAGDISVPTVSVNNANGNVSENVYKVYDDNASVIIEIPTVSGYYVTINGVELDTATAVDGKYIHNVGVVTADKEINVAYVLAGSSTISLGEPSLEEYINASAKNSEGKEVLGGAVISGDRVTVSVEPKTHYAIQSVWVVDEEDTMVFSDDSSPFEGSFIANEEGVPAGKAYKVGVSVYVSSSSLYVDSYETDIITINSNGYEFGDMVEAGNTVEISASVIDNYELTELYILQDGTDVVYAEGNLADGSIKFTSPDAENANNFTLYVSAKAVHNTVVSAIDENIALVEIFDEEGNQFAFGEKEIPVNSTVVVKTVLDAAYGYVEPPVALVVKDSKGNDVTVTGENGEYRFTTGKDEVYTLSFGDENANIENTQSTLTVGSVGNASLEYADNKGFDFGLDINAAVEEINLGTEVTITITPEYNHYIKSAEIVNADGESVATVSKSKGVWTLTFVANNNDYILNVETAEPVVAPNDEEVIINKYDIIAGKDDIVREKLFSGFDKAAGITELEYKYYAGTVVIPEQKILFFTTPKIEYDLWLGLNEGVNIDELAKGVWDALNNISSSIGKAVSVKTIKDILDKMGDSLFDNLHDFGDAEVESVKAIYGGSDDYMAVESEVKEVLVKDLRTEIDVDVHSSLTVSYGSYLNNADILAKLLEGKKGVCLDGVALDSKYTDMLVLSEELANANVGTYEVEVFMPNTDYDYKDSVKTVVTINIVKANVNVIATRNNVILHKHINSLTKDYLVKLSSNVIIEDEIGHISFLMGLDANLNDPAKPAIFATVDLSQIGSLNVGGFDVPVTDEVINVLIKALDKDGDGISLSELLDSADGIKSLISGLGFDVSMIESMLDIEDLEKALKALYGILSEYTQYGDVYIKFVNDESAIVPDSHGIYIVGAVTTDPNYKTAYDATYILVTAEPVQVKFHDVNGNNARQFKYDGTPKAMTAYALDEFGNEIEGNMQYLYTGVQSDGAPYLASEAPVHAGSYAVTAIFTDDTYSSVGMAIGAMMIWPSDLAEVGVSDKKVVVYNEENPTPVEIADMITILPAGTDAKVAVITAGIDVATDFSEEGFSALEGVINIDFPEKADTILKKVLPSAYTKEGITLSTFVSALTEIKAKLNEIGFANDNIDAIINALGELPDSAKLTFRNTYNGEVDADALPKQIGAYVVTAIVFDPDYQVEVGTGVLLIIPELIDETLAWNYNDMNGVITQPVLDIENLGASAKVNADNTALIKYVFVSLDKEGNVDVFTADNTNIEDVSRTLRNGAYTQIAYIWEGFDAKMVIAEPIVREFVHVPQQMHIDFAPDGNIDNVVKLAYTGSPIEMPIVIEKLDGTALMDGCLEVKYTGTDSLGNAYESTKAPTNVGVYTVTVTYKEYEMFRSGSLKYAGINVGILVIEPADHEFTIVIGDVECPCGCDTVTCDAECDCDVAVDVIGGISAIDDVEVITVVTDEEGNVNVIFPESWNVPAMSTVDSLNAILDKVAEFEKAIDTQPALEAIENIIAELKKIDVAKFGEDAQAVIDAAIAEIESITSADVKDALKDAVKELKEAGVDTAIVAEIETLLNSLKENSTITDVAKVLGAVVKVLEKIDTERFNGEIKAKLASVFTELKGLDTTIVKDVAKEIRDKAVAELEKVDLTGLGADVQAELNAIITKLEDVENKLENVVLESISAKDALKDILEGLKDVKSIAINGETAYDCGTYEVTSIAFGPNHIVKVATDDFTVYPPVHECSGGVANCQSPAICEVCNEPYGEKDPANHVGEAKWITTETKHTKKYDCCDEIVVAEEPHEWKDGVCEECDYECEHSGGKATCKEPAKCEICGDFYGEKDPTNHVGEEVILNAKEATEQADGYTGDKYWNCCGVLIEKGEKIPAKVVEPTPTPDPTPTPEVKPEATPAPNNGQVNTGDNSGVRVFASLAAASLAGLFFLIYTKKKLDEKEDFDKE